MRLCASQKHCPNERNSNLGFDTSPIFISSFAIFKKLFLNFKRADFLARPCCYFTLVGCRRLLLGWLRLVSRQRVSSRRRQVCGRMT